MGALLAFQQVLLCICAESDTWIWAKEYTVMILLNNLYWWRGVVKLPLRAFFKTYFSKKAEAPGMVIPGQMQELYRARVKLLM